VYVERSGLFLGTMVKSVYLPPKKIYVCLKIVLHPFQNVGCFGFSKFIVIAMHLDMSGCMVKFINLYIMER